MIWYENLIKPSFAPPSYLFGIAWSILYTIIFITFGYIVFLVYKGTFPKKIVLPLVLNLVFNALFSPIQFGLRSNFLAAIDITLVLGTIIWLIAILYKQSKVLALTQVPYLVWVAFATVLQFSITWLNR